MAVVVFTSVSTSTFTVPAGVTSLILEVIGGGATGGAGQGCQYGAGGSGGNYAKSVVTVTSGTVIYVKAGSSPAPGSISPQSGGDSWANTTNAPPTTSTTGVLAKGGGFPSACSIGSVKFAGGSGGPSCCTVGTEGGGGGAGGPQGAGGAGGGGACQTNAGGGGAGGLGTTAGSGITQIGGAGPNGTGGGAAGGGAGTNGGGGGGNSGGVGGAGGSYAYTPWAGPYGPGGGGGGSGITAGGTGGLYGGGGGGGAFSTAGQGAQGIVVITYASPQTLVARLNNSGTLFVNGKFDEVTKTVVSMDINTVYAPNTGGFDEVTNPGPAMRFSSTTVYVSNTLDEVTGAV
jgi:hypothetical protein